MKRFAEPFTIAALRGLLAYEPETGVLTHRATGRPALNSRCSGYRHGRLCGHYIRAHRAAFALAYGQWPAAHIDHINGNPSDNRLCNLRLCTNSQNMMNTKARSGFKGVHWGKAANKWVVQIRAHGKVYHIGVFADPIEAAKAYDGAATRLHGDFAVLNFPSEPVENAGCRRSESDGFSAPVPFHSTELARD